MKKLLGIIVLGLLLSGNAYAEIEKRVTAYEDDGYAAAWFTFKYKSTDIFTLSFDGSSEMAGVWIFKGEVMDTNNTVCLLLTNDPEKKLQELIRDVFMPKYGLGGSINVDPKNTISAVKGKISNTVLYYFLRAAQDSKNTKDYLKGLNCK